MQCNPATKAIPGRGTLWQHQPSFHEWKYIYDHRPPIPIERCG
jgi:hypothetical protein